jgi:hypothetical protein
MVPWLVYPLYEFIRATRAMGQPSRAAVPTASATVATTANVQTSHVAVAGL